MKSKLEAVLFYAEKEMFGVLHAANVDDGCYSCCYCAETLKEQMYTG